MLKLIGKFVSIPLLALAVDTAPDHLALAWRDFELGNYQGCLTEGAKAALLNTHAAGPHFILGRCFERSGDFEAAHSEFEIVTNLDSADADAFHNRAVLSLKMLNADQNEIDRAVWQTHFPWDRRIEENRSMLKGALLEVKKGELSLSEARYIIQRIYLDALESR